MSTYLFHSEVFMPERYKVPLQTGTLNYGNHAKVEALKDRYGSIPLPSEINLELARIIEAEFNVQDNEVVKQVWRQPLDEQRDIVLVVNRGGFVRTVWVNLRNDKHGTLDKSRYVRG